MFVFIIILNSNINVVFIVAEIDSVSYWRNPFQNICEPKHLIPFVVMDIEIINEKSRRNFPGMGAVSNKVYSAKQS